MEITTQMIKELREITKAGVMDCRKALETSGGEMQKAVEFLRQKGLETAAKRADRQASNGIVELYSHGNGRVGVMVEVNCETDFVARSEQFIKFAHELVLQVAATSPKYIREDDIPAEVLETEMENAKASAREEGKSDAILEKIVQGRVDKFKDEVVLMRQAYIRDDKMTVGNLLLEQVASIGENIVIRRFVRWELGEVSG